jgi:hypothetical protein
VAPPRRRRHSVDKGERSIEAGAGAGRGQQLY